MTSFERYAPLMCVFFVLGTSVPIIFGAVVAEGGSPIPRDLYGPVVWAIPAWVWIAFHFVFSVVAALGCGLQKKNLAFIGAAGLAAYLTTLAGMALSAGAPGTLVVAGSGGWLGPFTSVCAVIICWSGRNGGA